VPHPRLVQSLPTRPTDTPAAPNKWTHPFPRRPLLIPRTNTYSISQLYAIFLGIAIAEGFIRVLYPSEPDDQEQGESHRGTKFLIRFVAQIGIATGIIRALQWRSRRRYEQWFRTFDEGWRPEGDEASEGWWKRWKNLESGRRWRGLNRRDRRGEIEL